ncbi:MAG: hypothetical protein V3R98_10040 [Alphaproteobacteria bacterium]
MIETTSIAFAPLLPWTILAPLFGLCLVVLAIGIVRRARGAGLRVLVMAALAAALTNPALVQEERESIPDVAVIVVDESASQAIGSRAGRTDRALGDLTLALGEIDDLELRIVRSGGQADGQLGETRLFEALDAALGDVPRRRVAGAILLTDGQVHDVPPEAALEAMGPIHTLLTGDHDETDRRLSIAQAPAFGLVGREFTVTVRVDDLPARGGSGLVTLTASQDGAVVQAFQVPVGQGHNLTFTLDHGGATVIEFEVAAAARELTLANNRAAVVVNGVRDRLRVLLVSGEPHPGERTWRNILKSDPSVDLVHFTILRPPEKQDGTPISELSLISFPIRELFELRLNEFDLIIFDRYRRRGVLPNLYLSNIANYVQTGGAFLEASGPQFAAGFSLYRTPLGTVLPGEPTGQVIEQGYRPGITDLGVRHPVTSDLEQMYREARGLADDRRANAEAVGWGRWFRQIDVVPTSGSVVMDGDNARPLLILDRVGDGRVAQLMSDHLWLWSRGFEGGGPQAELLRRLAHWLMKEPELEENDLRAVVDDRRIQVEQRRLEGDPQPVHVVSPSGAVESLELVETAPGRSAGSYVAAEPGIFRIEDGERTALAVVGRLNPPELSDMRTTEERLAPIAEATGGAMAWLVDDGVPTVRRVRPERDAVGRDWIGLRANGDYLVTGAREAPLLPALLTLLLAVGGLMATWRREGR